VNARAALESILNFDLVGALGQNLECNARAVLELKELEYYFSNHWASNEPEYRISLLRQLRENFETLRSEVETEPDLVLPPIAAQQPVEEAAPEYEPVGSANRLGSLSEAVYK
jgi:hypothetical protein